MSSSRCSVVSPLLSSDLSSPQISPQISPLLTCLLTSHQEVLELWQYTHRMDLPPLNQEQKDEHRISSGCLPKTSLLSTLLSSTVSVCTQNDIPRGTKPQQNQAAVQAKRRQAGLWCVLRPQHFITSVASQVLWKERRIQD